MHKCRLCLLLACLWLGSILTLQAQHNVDAIKGVMSKTDTKTGQAKHVLPNIKLTAGTTQKLDMVFATGVNYSFVPAHIAKALHAKTIGEIDLAQKDPEVPTHLGLYNMNRTGQTRFQIVQVDKFDLGAGPPGGPVKLLVLDDKSSDFGIMGSNWPLKPSKMKGYTYFSSTDQYPNGALYYGPPPTRTAKPSR